MGSYAHALGWHVECRSCGLVVITGAEQRWRPGISYGQAYPKHRLWRLGWDFAGDLCPSCREDEGPARPRLTRAELSAALDKLVERGSVVEIRWPEAPDG